MLHITLAARPFTIQVSVAEKHVSGVMSAMATGAVGYGRELS